MAAQFILMAIALMTLARWQHYTLTRVSRPTVGIPPTPVVSPFSSPVLHTTYKKTERLSSLCDIY